MSASSLLMISDGKDFWGTDDISRHSQIATIGRAGEIQERYEDLSHLANKRVLVLVHGFNNTEEEIVPHYFNIVDKLNQIARKDSSPFYDVIIGYHAPLFDSRLEYFQAQNHCKLLAPRVRGHLDQLALQANTVDVVAHSMGNRLIFEALSSFGRRKVTPINHMFSLAAAVDDEALDRGEIYSSCLKRCREVSILFSRNDGVLKGLYPLAEFDSALGTAGSEDVSKLPSNSKQVDCTSLIDSHSAYLTALPVFYFIRNTLLGKIPSPQTTQTLELLSDGSVKILQKPSMPDLTTIVKAGAVAVAFVFGIWGIYRKAYGI